MKVSKGVLVALFLGIIIIGAGLLYTVWQNELDRRDSQNAALSAAQALLPPIQAGVTAAEAELKASQDKLAAARAALEEFKAQFPPPPPSAAIQSIDYGSKLFILAANNSLSLTEFHASDLASTTINGIKFQSTDMDIKVSGDILKINDFIGNLETSDPYLTATIESVNIVFFTEFDTELGAVPPTEATIFINLLALEG